ncbi:MAG: GAF domain-containing protein [Hyphomicrobiaceae bacterium]
MPMLNPDALLAGLGKLAVAQAEVKDQTAFFEMAAATAETLIGHKLFTVMAFHEHSMEVERLYSNQPADYPAGGRKKKRDTEWGQQVLERGEPYIGASADDIRRHFDDHEVIFRLGLESILNMPIKVGGRTIGTMNLLHVANYYSDKDLAAAQLIAGLMAGRMARGEQGQG